MIDIIIPVYNAWQDLVRCINSVLRHTPANARIVLINDASSDPRIAAYLTALQANHPDRVLCLSNEHNLGFVHTVNRGMALGTHDVVLLNSDTEVTPNWLTKLTTCVQSSPRVATVTPFSNNAEICSYPVFCHNTQVGELDLTRLCEVMTQAHSGHYPEIPTAVGFCMYIRREVLNAVGLFDAERFGRGYGEENEFCLRASAAGYTHLLCTDAYVVHHGGKSFLGDTRELKQRNLVSLLALYPDYEQQIAAFVAADPIAPYRQRIQAALNQQQLDALGQHSQPGLLLVTHALGGGVEKHIADLVDLLSPQVRVEVLRPNGNNTFSLQDAQGNPVLFAASPWDALITALQSRRYARLHIHHVHGYPPEVTQLPQALQLPTDITVHDFAAYCPQYSLSQPDGTYCGEPDSAGCNRCVQQRPHAWGMHIGEWRHHMHGLLQTAQRIMVPSSIVADKLHAHWPDLPLQVMAHPPRHEWLNPVQPLHKVVVMGGLSPTKGLDRVVACATEAQLHQRPLHFVLLGYTSHAIAKFPDLPITVTGQYEDEDLPKLLALQRADSIWFPSQIPETYSYTLDVALVSGLPVVADTGTGALAERLQTYAHAHLLPPAASAQYINEIMGSLSANAPNTISLADPQHALAERQAYARELLNWRDTDTTAHPVEGVYMLRNLAEPPIVSTQPPMTLQTLFEHGVECGHTPSRLALAQRVKEADQLYVALEGVAQRAGQPWYQHLDQIEMDLRDQSEKLQVAATEMQERIAQHLEETQRRVAQHQSEIEQSTQAQNALHVELSRIQNEFQQAVIDGAQREQTIIHTYEQSISWRMTAPLRNIGNTLRTIQRGLKRWPFALQILKEQGLWVLLKRIQGKLAPPQAPVAPLVLDVQGLQPISPLTLNTCPAHQQPKVSIVIPVYGQHHYSFNCLHSLVRHTDLSTVEVIVVDDASPDAARLAMPEVQGVQWLRNQKNLGFIGSCNAGAAQARGEFVLMLNNDVQVTAGWLDALLAVFSLRSDAGLVGARLVYPDGTLQEAGGILWQDGSAWNWGRNGDPELPTYKYLRPADYCSGACLLMRMSDWQALHGFDTAFTPAYYEDTDLAFRVRAAGQVVYYQPEAVIVHYEGVSSGTDVTQGAKRHQVINQATFFDRWKTTLASHRLNGVEPLREVNRWASHHMLIVEACMITPDQDSGSVRMQALLEILVGMGVHVTFVAENLEYRQPYVRDLQQQGVEVWYAPHIQSVTQLLEQRGSLFDTVMICRHYIASPLIDAVRKHAPQAKLWFDTVDLHYLREERLAALEQSSRLADVAAVTRQQELGVIAACDLTFVVSPVEQGILAQALPDAQVDILSNIHEPMDNTAGYSEREGLLFVGGFQHPPNVDAVTWFVQEVWPLVHAQAPDMTVRIVGSKMPDTLRSLAGPGIEILGFVQDIDPLLATSRISIAPLRYGAGVKGKVNQAMSHGLPVVATPAAVEGMDLTHGEHVLVANTPAAYAQEIIRLYNDPVLWEHLVAGGKSNVAQTFSRDIAREVLAKHLVRHCHN